MAQLSEPDLHQVLAACIGTLTPSQYANFRLCSKSWLKRCDDTTTAKLGDFLSRVVRTGCVHGQSAERTARGIELLLKVAKRNGIDEPALQQLVASDVLCVPAVPLEVAKAIVSSTGFIISQKQLLTVGDAGVRGVEVWIQAADVLGKSTSLMLPEVYKRLALYGMRGNMPWWRVTHHESDYSTLLRLLAGLPAEEVMPLLRFAAQMTSPGALDLLLNSVLMLQQHGTVSRTVKQHLDQLQNLEQLLPLAAACGSSNSIKLLCSRSAAAPQVSPSVLSTTLDIALRQPCDMQDACEALLSLPNASHIDKNVVLDAVILSCKATVARLLQVVEMLAAWCPCAAPVSAAVTSLVQHAQHQGNCSGLTWLQQLPGCMAMTPERLVDLLFDALEKETAGPMIAVLCSYPAAQRLDDGTVSSLLLMTLQLHQDHGNNRQMHVAVDALCGLQGAKQLDEDAVIGLMHSANESGCSVCAKRIELLWVELYG